MTYRNFLSICFTAVIVLLVTESVFSQRPFRGRIIYTITYPGSMIDLAELEQLPDRAVIYTKNNLVRTELSGENAGLFQVKISDPDRGETATMLEILREKYVIHKGSAEIQNALRNMPQPEFEYTDETREILGYTCRKVIARISDDFGNEYESEIWYTNEIPGNAFNFDTPYNQIPGLMLQYEMRVGPLNIRYEAQSVRRRMFVGNRNFRVPRDYENISYDDLRSRLQGNF